MGRLPAPSGGWLQEKSLSEIIISTRHSITDSQLSALIGFMCVNVIHHDLAFTHFPTFSSTVDTYAANQCVCAERFYINS